MRRPAALVAAAGVLLGALAVLGVAVPVGALARDVPAAHFASTIAAPTSSDADPAETAFSSCLRGSRRGNMLLLIDESPSIAQTDEPEEARVTAAEYLVSQLARTTAASGVSLAVSVAAFGDVYRKVLDWKTLGPGSGLVHGALESLRGAHGGFDTDYWTALDSSRRAIEARTDGNSQACDAIVWFTDGELDIASRDSGSSDHPLTKPYSGTLKLNSNTNAGKAQTAAATDLCRPTGLADSIRSDGIKMFAIGLQKPGPAHDFSLLRRIATGRGGTKPCGALLNPSPGSFHLVSGIDGLLFAFDGIASPKGSKTNVVTTPICQAAPTSPTCARARQSFILDASIKSVHILGTSSITDASVALMPPTGAPVVLADPKTGRSTSVTVAGSQISWAWESAHTLAIDMAQPATASAWVGQWSLVFADPSKKSARGTATSNIHISSDIAATWVDPAKTSLRAGERVSGVRLSLVSAGKVVPVTSILGTITLTAILLDSAGSPAATVATGVKKDNFDAPLTLDLSRLTPGQATLRLELAVTTARSAVNGRPTAGTALDPAVTDVPLTILAPLDYPKVADKVSFGSVEGAAHKSASVTITGSGCVWVQSSAAKVRAAPAGTGGIRFTSKHASQATCQKVSGTSHLDVQLATDHQGSGPLKGVATVWAVPGNGTGKALPAQVSYTMTMQTVLKTWNFIAALIIALILGPGVPLLLLYLSKWWAGRMPPGTLLAERLPIRVTPEDVLRDGVSLTLHDRDFIDHPAVIAGRGTRRIDILGVALKVAVTLSPGRPCDVVVEVPDTVSASSSNTRAYDRKLRARLPLALREHWVLLHSPQGPADLAELLIMVLPQSTAVQRTDLLEQARQRIPALLTTLRADARNSGRVVSEDRTHALAGFDTASGNNPFAPPGAQDDFGFDAGPHSAGYPPGPGVQPGPGMPPAPGWQPGRGQQPGSGFEPGPQPAPGPQPGAGPQPQPRGAPHTDEFGFDGGTGFPDGGTFPDGNSR